MRCHSSPVSPRQAADLSCRVGMSPERRWEILRFTAGCKSFSTRFSNENDVVHRSVFLFSAAQRVHSTSVHIAMIEFKMTPLCVLVH
ncbi:hypothetical protein BLNAU_9059 [Blattamonas nauphoetae]|uniref:Uncharacterized protein n=1 Tax=Blattamonas nauphoetae TaxID=2049346 RepID=A0ABQ9XWP8_9EUKA|nr:hypothetical protein BLNAU_9059 [Blattamonas nauphoetae]